MLDVSKTPIDDFLETHTVNAGLQKEAPASWTKKTLPYQHGQPVSNIDLLLYQRCYTPYMGLYSLFYQIKVTHWQSQRGAF